MSFSFIIKNNHEVPVALLTAAITETNGAAVAVVPGSSPHHAEMQKILDQVNEYRTAHCADRLKWSPEMEEKAKQIVECQGDDCKSAKKLHSTMSWLSMGDKVEYFENNKGEKKVESSDMDVSRLVSAPEAWYDAAGDGKNKSTKTEMIDVIKNKGVNEQSSFYAVLIWRAGLSMGCAVAQDADTKRDFPKGTLIEGELPTRARISCVFQSLLSGPGATVPGDDPYKLYHSEIYPAQMNPSSDCAPVKKSYKKESLFEFSNVEEAFLRSINLYRSDTCAPKLQVDQDLKAGVDMIMGCYSNLNKGDGISDCEEKYAEAFPVIKDGRSGKAASILARTDYCDVETGCGTAFNHPESRAVIGVYHWFDRFRKEAGQSAAGLTHGQFIQIFKNLSPEKKSNLNVFAILSWASDTKFYCDLQSRKFADSDNIETSYIICAFRGDDDTKPPAQEMGTGPDRYDIWLENLVLGNGCAPKPKATDPVDEVHN